MNVYTIVAYMKVRSWLIFLRFSLLSQGLESHQSCWLQLSVLTCLEDYLRLSLCLEICNAAVATSTCLFTLLQLWNCCR